MNHREMDYPVVSERQTETQFSVWRGLRAVLIGWAAVIAFMASVIYMLTHFEKTMVWAINIVWIVSITLVTLMVFIGFGCYSPDEERDEA